MRETKCSNRSISRDRRVGTLVSAAQLVGGYLWALHRERLYTDRSERGDKRRRCRVGERVLVESFTVTMTGYDNDTNDSAVV